MLHILDEYGICATFFTVGLFVDYYPDLTRQIVDSGHVLACHSYSHDYAKLYVSAETILSDLAAWEQAVTRAVGEAPTTRLYRFPGGTTSYSLTKNEAYPELLEAIVQAGLPSLRLDGGDQRPLSCGQTRGADDGRVFP